MNISLRWAALAGTSLLAVGCATQQQTATLQCGAGGAVIGFAACMALGHSSQHCAAVAAAGAAVGAVGCYTYAGQLEKRRQALAGRENDLDARLAYMRGLNQDAEHLNVELNERVVNATKRSDELVKKVAAKQTSTQQLETERTRLDADLKEANKQYLLQQQALDEMKAYQAKTKATTPSQTLDAEIAKGERLLADTRQQVQALASVRERVARV